MELALPEPCLPDPSLYNSPEGCLKEKLWVLFFLKLSTLWSSSSMGFFCFFPNWGHKVSGMNFKIKATTQLSAPKITAMIQCYQGRPPNDTSNAIEKNSIMMICMPAMTNQMPKNITFLVMPSKIFFSSLIFLQLIMLNTCMYTKMLKTLVM